MTENNRITIREIAKHLGISDRAVKKRISQLKNKGIIQRVGLTKAGRWMVHDQP